MTDSTAPSEKAQKMMIALDNAVYEYAEEATQGEVSETTCSIRDAASVALSDYIRELEQDREQLERMIAPEIEATLLRIASSVPHSKENHRETT